MRQSLDPYKEIGNRPLVAASIAGEDGLMKSANRAYAQGADFIEVRIDTFHAKEIENISDLLSAFRSYTPIPLIGTVRSRLEQEPKSKSLILMEDERKAIYECAIPFVELIDVEMGSSRIIRSLIDQAHRAGKKVIVSHHDFHGIPDLEKIDRLLEKFIELSGDILKIAGMAKSNAEAENLMESCRNLDHVKRIFIAMGNQGRFSRLEGFSFGSCMSYGYVSKSLAPGQVSVKELVKYFKSHYPSSM